MTPQEQADLGYYNVFKILKHKFQQGWKFLVQWENFPVSASTWEPISAFVLPNGSVNSIFKEYCEERGLQSILKKTLALLVSDSFVVLPHICFPHLCPEY